MSESESFIREVSEQVRRERLTKFMGRYGWIGALVILLVILGAAFVEWRKSRDQAAAEATGDALRAAYLVEEPAGRAEALAGVAAERPDAAVVARIAEAGALAEAGDTVRAAEVLAVVAEAPGTGPIYRDLALLQRVALLGQAMPESEQLATLEALTRDDGPFRPLALEQRALARLGSGELASAQADLEAILALPNVTEALAARASQLLVATGASLPGAAAAGAPNGPEADG